MDFDPETVPLDSSYKLERLLSRLFNQLSTSSSWVEDEYVALRRGVAIDDSLTNQAATMITTGEVQSLLRTPLSAMLLVNGCSDRAQAPSTISPVSFVCANLARTLRQRPDNITLLYFCGQHLSLKDGLCGPQGMLRSLMAQLILVSIQQDLVLGQRQPRNAVPLWFWEARSRFDLVDLCQLFHWLLSLLPEWVGVICIADGISHYEAEQWRSDYYLVLDCFDSIVKDKSLTTSFKLLMTSPTTSRQLPHHISHGRVSLRAVNGGAAHNTAAYRPLEY